MDISAYIVSNLPGIIAGVVAIFGYLFGFRQYRKGQRWQKAQVLMALIDSFEKDELVDAACKMLDWDERPMDIEDQNFLFSNDMLISALRVVPWDKSSIFTPPEVCIRDSFDAFFDYFDRLHNFQKLKLLDFEDYQYFFYWFHMVDNISRLKGENKPGVGNTGDAIEKAIINYCASYKFKGFEALLDRFRTYSRLHPEIIAAFELDLPSETGSPHRFIRK